jgi:hypothetical protein
MTVDSTTIRGAKIINTMGKPIRNVFKTETFTLTECTDGYFLWDQVRKINIAMYAKTEQSALIEGLLYYQRRCAEISKDYKELDAKVQLFFSQFNEEDD